MDNSLAGLDFACRESANSASCLVQWRVCTLPGVREHYQQKDPQNVTAASVSVEVCGYCATMIQERASSALLAHALRCEKSSLAAPIT